MDIEERPVLEAKLKCSIIKDLFSQIIKNTKASRLFFMNVHEGGIKMVFMESDKEVEIFIGLHKERFLSYDFTSINPAIFKYDIRDLEPVGMIFENQNSILTLIFKEDSLCIQYENEFLGWTNYMIDTIAQIEEIPEEVHTIEQVDNSEEIYTKVFIGKLKKLTVILHSFGLQRIDNVEFNLKSVNGQIEITPLPDMINSNRPNEDARQTFKLNVVYKRTQILKHFRFNLRKFKICLGLFDKNNPLEINFYSNYIKLEGVEKEKKNVTIIFACLADV